MESLIQVLLAYGLFLAKTMTILIGIAVLLILAVRLRHGGHGGSEQLEITDLNQRYRALSSELKAFSLSKKAFKAYRKAEHKEEGPREGGTCRSQAALRHRVQRRHPGQRGRRAAGW